MDYETLSHRLSASFPSLSPRLRQAARFLLDHPDEVALTSMRGLADAAGVHPSNMVRLAQAIGLDGFEDLRQPFRDRLRRNRRFAGKVRALRTDRGSDPADALLGTLQQNALDNIVATFGIEGQAAMRDIALRVNAARTVHVLGLRASFPAAHTFHHAYRMVKRNSVLVGGAGGMVVDDLRGIGPGDLLLVFGFQPYSRDSVRAARFARRRKAAVAALTDSRLSPLAEPADETLVIANESPSFFQSTAATVAAAEALVVLVVALGEDDAVQAIEESERNLDAFETYWEATAR